MSHKILISSSFRAGWSTWVYGGREAKVFALTYQPIINYLEHNELPIPQPMLDEYVAQMEERFGEQPYLGGARDLKVVEVDGPFYINEYDGSESVVLQSDPDLYIDFDKDYS